jgi:hypothetical protein
MSIIPQTFEEVQRFAAMAVRSGLWKAAKDEDAEVTLARCCLAVMTGLDVGLSPAQAIQCIAVINGRCLIYGDAVPGVLWAHGFDIEQSIDGDGDARAATCTITRPGGKKITRTFSVADAKRARLWDERKMVERYGKTLPNDAPWHRFPDRMLGWRALGFAKSDGASDVMRGLDIQENMIDLNHDEYSEIKTEPKKVAAPVEIDDIPEPQQPGSDDVVQEAPADDDQPWDAGLTDQQFMDKMSSDFSTARDAGSLDEYRDAYEEAVSRRGLEQQAGDLYSRHRSTIEVRA